jgi:UMP-CMP kinase
MQQQQKLKQDSAKDADTSAVAAPGSSSSSSAAPAVTNQEDVLSNCQVVFVLGGPGAGKGTQCQLLSQRLSGWIHLSAGDLLRAELQNPNSTVAPLIRSFMEKGQLVPSSITVQLLEQAMTQHAADGSKSPKFLIDGFPRSTENVQAWEENTATSHAPLALVLCLECPEEVLVGRLLERGQTSGRQDDTIDVIRKRFQTFKNESYPIIDQYGDKVRRIASDKSVEEVYQEIASLLESL